MPMVDVFGARKFQTVMEDTFGHLRVKRGTRHKGHMTFATSIYDGGLVAVLDQEFGDAVGASPWLYEDTFDFISEVVKRLDKTDDRGTVYRFTGEYVCYKNGRRRFVGKVRRLRLPKPR